MQSAGKRAFCLKLFEANAELYEVMEDFSSSDTQGAVFFYNHVEKIYGLFSSLTEVQIDQFKQWYQGNNDLEKYVLMTLQYKLSVIPILPFTTKI